MLNWYENEARQRQKDRLAEAEHSRLIKLSGAHRAGSNRLSGRALLWLGHRLVESGERIQRDGI